MMAVLYEIEQSGFADSLRSGIVVTGGCAQTANLANLIYDISGFKVRIGYPQKTFSCEGCDGLAETSAATAIGLIMASLNDPSINCATVNTNEPAAETVVEEVSVVGNEDEPQGSLFKKDEEEKKPEVKVTEKHQPTVKKKKKVKLTIFGKTILDTFENLFDALDEDKVSAAPATNDEDEEDTEEKA